MTRLEITQQITQKMFKTDAASVLACNGFVRRRYRMIYDGSLWRDALFIESIPAATNVLILPEGFEVFVGARWNSEMVDPVELSYLLRTDPSAFERTGAPQRVSELQPLALNALPASEKLSFVSDSSSDVALSVLIRGELAKVPQYEIITLNGLVPVQSSKSWDKVTTCAKDVTTGTVSVSGVTTAAAYLSLWPDETEKKYLRVQLFDSPTDLTQSLLILGKRRFQDLVFDQDSPIIRAIENALLAFVEGDMLKRERQYGKARDQVEEGSAMLNTAMNVGVYQTATTQQVTPDTNGEYNRNDFE